MDIKSGREAANVKPLRSKIFSFFTFEVCMFLAAAIIFSVHLSLKKSDEKLLNEGVAVQGVITEKIKIKKTANKGKDGFFYEYTLHYRFNYYSREYMDSNIVKQRLWDKVNEGDTILLAVDSDNPKRSRIKSSDVIKGIIPTLLFVSILPFFTFGIISLVVSLIQKLLDKKKN